MQFIDDSSNPEHGRPERIVGVGTVQDVPHLLDSHFVGRERNEILYVRPAQKRSEGMLAAGRRQDIAEAHAGCQKPQRRAGQLRFEVRLGVPQVQ